MTLELWTARPERLKPLECDICGAVFGWVDELDLNGSYFVCHQCRAQHLPAEKASIEPNGDKTVTLSSCGVSKVL